MREIKNLGLPEKTLQQIVHCISQHPEIRWAKVYGSRAKGNYETGSDIDVAVSSEVNRAGHLWGDLDELPTPYSFDVTHYESLTNQNLKSHIDRVGVLIYEQTS